MVKMELARIMISETSDHQVIVLKESDGQRSFPIVIGLHEAWA
ncbi:MAG: bifunctional nuclease family protein, partial [Planctomycetes bacterium]|nr:bifunctional nuclease family protein [Planctomycetota bacterium]